MIISNHGGRDLIFGFVGILMCTLIFYGLHAFAMVFTAAMILFSIWAIIVYILSNIQDKNLVKELEHEIKSGKKINPNLLKWLNEQKRLRV